MKKNFLLIILVCIFIISVLFQNNSSGKSDIYNLAKDTFYGMCRNKAWQVILDTDIDEYKEVFGDFEEAQFI